MPVSESVSRRAWRRAAAAIGLSVSLAMPLGCAGGAGGPDAGTSLTSVSGPGANGVDVMAPQQALERTRDALETASSFRVEGSSTSGGPINLAFVRDAGAIGTVSSGGSPVQLVAVGGRVYVKGDDGFISRNVGPDAVKTLSGKWLLLPPGSTSGFAIFADGARFAAGLLDSSGKVERTKVANVDGRLAVGLVFTETGERVWVSARGPSLPVRFEEKGASGDQGVLRFLDYGKPVSIAAPAGAAVVDAEKLLPVSPSPSASPGATSTG